MITEHEIGNYVLLTTLTTVIANFFVIFTILKSNKKDTDKINFIRICGIFSVLLVIFALLMFNGYIKI